MNASWPQTKTIWGICVKVKYPGYTGDGTDPLFWRKIAEDGTLTREKASAIISAFIDKRSNDFHRLVTEFDPHWHHDTDLFAKARRWTPKKKYDTPKEPEAPKEEPESRGGFKVGDRVVYTGGVYSDKLKDKEGTVRSLLKGQSLEPIGVEYDDDINGHSLTGVLKGDSTRGWYCAPDSLKLIPFELPDEAEQERAEPIDPDEDEFTRKLRELEEAHKKAKEEAARKRKMEKFNPDSIEYVKPEIFDDVCAMIKGGVQVCLVGPSGCGKSLLINEVARVLKRDLYMESFAGGKRYSQVFGSTHLVDGKSEWVPAKFLTELQKENMIIFMDEVMSADADVLIGANPILDRKTRTFHSPVGPIKVNQSCTICAASNVTGREYSMNYKGTQQQDASVLNRFVHIHMGYDKRVEKTILKNSPLDKADQDELFKSLEALRASVASNNISYDPSTRKLVQAIELMALGLPREKAFEYAFLTPLSVVERRKIGM